MSALGELGAAVRWLAADMLAAVRAALAGPADAAAVPPGNDPGAVPPGKSG